MLTSRRMMAPETDGGGRMPQRVVRRLPRGVTELKAIASGCAGSCPSRTLAATQPPLRKTGSTSQSKKQVVMPLPARHTLPPGHKLPLAANDCVHLLRRPGERRTLEDRNAAAVGCNAWF